MRPDSPDRYCKECGADWLDKPIPEESLHMYNSPPYKTEGLEDWREKYDRFEKEIAEGKFRDAPWFHTHFSRRIGIYDMGADRTTAYQCPDCEHIVGRVP